MRGTAQTHGTGASWARDSEETGGNGNAQAQKLCNKGKQGEPKIVHGWSGTSGAGGKDPHRADWFHRRAPTVGN